MEAPRGVQVSAAAGDFKATCRKELHLQSTEGEVSSEEQALALYSGGRGVHLLLIILQAYIRS